ncbi:MAG: hypothetical protein EXR43_02240 [Dehalococcoidia bacterium]|nr:hypothetical protein [Dehalococcoidia bacterium]
MSNIFGIGIPEVLVVVILLLIVVGPERLPTVARQVGRMVGQMQQYARAFRDEYLSELSDLKSEVEATTRDVVTVRRQLSDASASINTEIRGLDEDFSRAAGEVNATLQAVDSTARILPDTPPANVVAMPGTGGEAAEPSPPAQPPQPERQRH